MTKKRTNLKKSVLIGGLASMMMVGFAPAAGAFSDIKNDPNKAAIQRLEQKGLFGNGNVKFHPYEEMNYAQGVLSSSRLSA